MGVSKLSLKTSGEDYLKAEEVSPVKHEFVEGEVYEMAGTSDRHNLIAGDLYALLLISSA
ncbi:MAG: Uma2 family endonuclease [Pyrinomonadaceae bacterium]